MKARDALAPPQGSRSAAQTKGRKAHHRPNATNPGTEEMDLSPNPPAGLTQLHRLAALMNPAGPAAAGVLQLKKTKGRDKHDRKDRRRLKEAGTIHEVEDRAISVAQPGEEHEEEPTAVAVDKSVIAAEFSRGVQSQGFQPFLAGGAALALQGGARPMKDLDFRLTTRNAGFKTFHEPQGAVLLRFINQVLLKQSRDLHHDLHNAQADTFQVIGEDGLTIGTANWFGVEVSLSMTGFDDHHLVNLSEQGGPDVLALGLHDLQADKLKTMISRTKRGAESVKKVSQDLFDFIDVSRLINQRPNSALTMSEHVDRASKLRLEQYRVANLERKPLHHLGDEKVRKLMRARAVLTAASHVKGGARRHAFHQLAANHLDSGKQRKAMFRDLEDLSRAAVEPGDKHELRPWMQQWNARPQFGPAAKFKRGGGRPATSAGDKPVDEVMAGMPENFLAKRIAALHLDANEAKVVRILALSGGFRRLPDSNRHMDTLMGVGLTKGKFSEVFKSLQEKELVEGKADGLHLSANGKQELGLQPNGDFYRTDPD